MRKDVTVVGRFGRTMGDRDQSAPSAVALTDKALTMPEQNLLTHLQVECMPDIGCDCSGAAPFHLPVRADRHFTNGRRREVMTRGAVDVSPFRGLGIIVIPVIFFVYSRNMQLLLFLLTH
jgi:hypothetical protein